jgi:hypothetical protein
MKKFIVRCARHPDGREFLDLEFLIRPGRYSDKWVECIRSIQGQTPHNWGFPKFSEGRPEVYQDRIRAAVSASPEIAEFLAAQGIADVGTVDQNTVNTIHRFIEQNKADAADHLILHNDIHFLEGMNWRPVEIPMKKLQWVPPGLLKDMEYEDYLDFTTEPCENFIQDDFSHVGRSPHGSYLTRDDTSLDSSCVIQHKVGSGVKWFLPDDSHIFHDAAGFQDWVSEHQEFFRTRWGIQTNTDPRLCFGRVIIATGAEDYSKMDRTFDYITSVFISE